MSTKKITAKYKVKNISTAPFRVNVRNRESLVLAPGQEKLLDHTAFDAYTKSLKPWIVAKVIEVSPYVDEVGKPGPESKLDPSKLTPNPNMTIPSRGGSSETGHKFYTREELKTLTREQINEIAKSVGASPARSKDDLINNVLATQIAEVDPEGEGEEDDKTVIARNTPEEDEIDPIDEPDGTTEVV